MYPDESRYLLQRKLPDASPVSPGPSPVSALALCMLAAIIGLLIPTLINVVHLRSEHSQSHNDNEAGANSAQFIATSEPISTPAAICTANLESESVSVNITLQGNAEWYVRGPARPRLSGTFTLQAACSRLAVVVMDVWDRHWCPSYERRANATVLKIDAFVRRLRACGARIIFTPFGTEAHYQHHPAFLHTLRDVQHSFVDLPAAAFTSAAFEDDGSIVVGLDQISPCDDIGDEITPNVQVWGQMHPDLHVDPAVDYITWSDAQLYRLLTQPATCVDHVLYVGFALNMCLLTRPTGLLRMARWGLPVIMVRDLTTVTGSLAASGSEITDGIVRAMSAGIEFVERYIGPTTDSINVVL